MAKSIGRSILVGAPHSEMRYRNAKHICADCVESAPVQFKFSPFSLGPMPLVIHDLCSVCEEQRTVAIVKVYEKERELV